ncbi:MAG: LptF/LptG family permease [Candidatus Brocadiia bacterium]
MVFKKIDRYIGWAFLSRFLGAVCVLGLLYVTFDLLKRLEDVQQAELQQAVQTVASYYGYLLPLFMAQIVPGFLLVSAGMVLVHMAQQRELLVLKASGTSVYRTVAPIFFWTLLITVGVYAFQETLGPRFARRREMLNRVLDNDVEHELLVKDARRDSTVFVFVGQYEFPTQSMKRVCVMELLPGNPPRPGRVIQADSGSWGRDDTIVLEAVEVRRFDESGTPVERSFAPTISIETGLRPFDFARAAQDEGESVSLSHTLPELYRLMRRQPDVPHFRVLFHSRLASFFSPFILLLVGIPCLIGFEHSVGSRFLSVIISIVVAAGFYALTFVFTSMGETQTIPAVLAAWLPPIAGGSLGLWLFQAMLT